MYTTYTFVVLYFDVVHLRFIAQEFCTGLMVALMGTLVTNADTLVVAVPTLVFVRLLPGPLHFEVAFDIQRSEYVELSLCLLPASATAWMLITVCAYEVIDVGVLLTT